MLLRAEATHAQSTAVASLQIAEVYGDAVASMSAEQLAWLHNQLERSMIKELPRQAGEQYPLLSEQKLNTKFVPGLQRDAFTLPLNINPLKYTINFFSTKDQIFRIDGTDYVLFVAKKP